jgi:exopolysaccharide production protein ExoQ
MTESYAVDLDAPRISTRQFDGEARVAVAILILFMGAVAGMLDAQITETGQGASGGLLFKVMLGGAYAFVAFVTVRDRSFVPKGRRSDWCLTLLLALAFASVAWSSIPGRSLSRALELLFTTWFGAYVGRRYELEEQVLILAYAIIIVEALCVIAALLVPDLAVMHGEFEGAWRGVFGHKNALGRVAFLGCLVFGITTRLPRHRVFGWTGLIASGFLLLMSTSSSALVGTLAVAAMVPLFRSLKHRGIVFTIYLVAAVAIPVAVGVWAYTHVEQVLELLGKNVTLSGRTTLWFTVASFVAQRPLLGYGYNAFWQGMNGDSGFISLLLRWEVPHSHNGILELALDTGLLGVALFAGSFLMTLRQAVRVQKEGLRPSAMWPLLGLCFIVITNLTESSLLRTNNTFWLVYLFVAFGTNARNPVESE